MRHNPPSNVWLAAIVCGGALWCTDAAAVDEATPDAGFLEYLGGLVEQDGKWIGPDDMGQVTELPADPEAGASSEERESEEQP